MTVAGAILSSCPSSASDPVELHDGLRQSQVAACADAHDQGYPRRVHY